MKYMYGAMLLHSAKQPINEENMKKVLTAAGMKPEEAQIKAVVAALDGMDIEEAIKKAAAAQVAVAAPVAAAGEAKAEKAEAKKEAKDEKKSEEEAAAGLGALFG